MYGFITSGSFTYIFFALKGALVFSTLRAGDLHIAGCFFRSGLAGLFRKPTPKAMNFSQETADYY